MPDFRQHPPRDSSSLPTSPGPFGDGRRHENHERHIHPQRRRRAGPFTEGGGRTPPLHTLGQPHHVGLRRRHRGGRGAGPHAPRGQRGAHGRRLVAHHGRGRHRAGHGRSRARERGLGALHRADGRGARRAAVGPRTERAAGAGRLPGDAAGGDGRAGVQGGVDLRAGRRRGRRHRPGRPHRSLRAAGARAPEPADGRARGPDGRPAVRAGRLPARRHAARRAGVAPADRAPVGGATSAVPRRAVVHDPRRAGLDPRAGGGHGRAGDRHGQSARRGRSEPRRVRRVAGPCRLSGARGKAGRLHAEVRRRVPGGDGGSSGRRGSRGDRAQSSCPGRPAADRRAGRCAVGVARAA